MTYLIRVNLDIKDTEDESRSFRFLTAAKTVKLFSGKNNKVVILSHRGRPEGRDSRFSLRKFAKLFTKYLNRKVIFIDNIEDLSEAKGVIDESPVGSVFLMQNLRFLKGEGKNDLKLARSLGKLGDVFINDDFATAHRENASNSGITKFIKSKMGPSLRAEVTNLKRAIAGERKPFTLIIGGAKMKDKIGVIKSLIKKVDYVLLGGGAANTFLKASSEDIGSSIFEPELISTAKELLKTEKIVLPLDFREQGGSILDIGPKTVKLYSDIISKSKTIIWGGPMGYFENPKFAKGSRAIAKAIAKSKGFSVVGGGETVEILRELKLDKRIDFVSTGGGAMLDFLAGKKMPGIAALQ